MQVIAQSRAYLNYIIMSYYKPQINYQVLHNGKRVSSHTTYNAARKIADKICGCMFGNERTEIVNVNTGEIWSV